MNRVRATAAPGWAISIGLHVIVLAVLIVVVVPSRRKERRRPPVKVSLVTRKPPPQQPRPTATRAETRPTPKRTPKPRLVKRRPVRREKIARPTKPEPVKQPQQAQAPPPTTPPAAAPAAAPPRFAVSLEATVPGGGVALPATPGGSGSAFAEPRSTGETRRAARGERSRAAPASEKVSDAADVTTLPRLLAQPSEEQMRAAYPSSARDQGLEGNVQLKILVSTTGQVTKVRVLRRAGNGFDEAARRLVRKFRFRAGTANGKPVAVWIPWTYKFRLNG